MKSQRSRAWSLPLLISTTATSALYLVLAVRLNSRLGSFNFFTTVVSSGAVTIVLVTTIVLYVVTLIQAIVFRKREGALIPVFLAALLGSLVCFFFTGF